uniref:Uncharacterized protein n=1 Tax=Rhizophora mucronata TaxID=61149 RepID=A0A2P2NSW4_RHIMU
MMLVPYNNTYQNFLFWPLVKRRMLVIISVFLCPSSIDSAF